ncbi:hypothetical protein D9M70_528340 [compost metagenome]
MAAHDAGGWQADDLGGAHIVSRDLHHGRGAYGSRVLHPFVDGDGEDQHQRRPGEHRLGAELRAGNAADEQCDENGGEADKDIGDAHHDAIDHAAEEAGEQAEHDAEHGRKDHCAEADDDGDPQAEQDDRDKVAALVVGAEQEAGIAALHEGWRNFHVHQRIGGDVARVHRRDHRREDDEDQHDDEHQAGDDNGNRRKSAHQGLRSHYRVLRRGSMKV